MNRECTYLPALGFILCPEGRDGGNGRTDMVVRQVRNNGVVLDYRNALAFEGKARSTHPPLMWPSSIISRNWLAIWATSLGSDNINSDSFAVGAQAVLMARQQGAGPNNIEEVRFPAGGAMTYGQNNRSLTVAGGIDAAELGRLLQGMANAVANNPNNGWLQNFTQSAWIGPMPGLQHSCCGYEQCDES